MSTADTTVIVVHNPPRRRRWSKEQPPLMRIVLLGKSVSENSLVGNFILGRAAFDSEAPPDVVERVGGRLKDRHVIIINSPQLLQTNISDHQITQTVRECVYLSDPGPHVFIIILQYKDFTEEDRYRVEYVLESFSEEAMKRTIVLTTDEETDKGASVKVNEFIQQLTAECAGGHVQFNNEIEEWCSIISQRLEKILGENHGKCELLYDAEETLLDEDQSRSFASLRTKEEDSDGGVSATRQQKLNLVLCGSDETLKKSISKLLKQKRRDVELHDRLISLVELPALIGLSEEEVMRQTLRCVSLCHPGVHAFILIIPDAPLTDEDKAEMEEIHRIFSSRINKHLMILIKQSSEHQTTELNEETQSVIQRFGGRHQFFGPKTQVSTLMENIEQMLEENRGECFSTEMFLEAQMKKLMKYEEMKKKINSLETHLLSQGSSENEDDLRIVLLGKTGVGKSATGNTILGREAFTAETSHESVTKESQRQTSDINSRRVTVIDTPGLFDTELSNEEIQREIRHCISMILPGPHVFIIVLNLGQRFTQEEATAVKIIQETFGENSLMFTMVLFTRGDDLKKKTIDQFLGKPGSPLMNLIEACGNRYHVFNNNQTGDRTQVTDLLEKINNMLKTNGGSYYSCKMFREMEREKQEQQMKILIDRVREREEENERMKMMMEEERQNQDKERKRREEELREREEQYKREMKEQEEQMRDEMKREREMLKDEMRQEKETVKKEKENLQTEIDRLMNRIENERQNDEAERKRREDEFNEREERYKTLMKEREREMREEMKREREEREKQKQEEKMRREEEDNKRIENERQHHDKERKRRGEEFNEREERYKSLMKEREREMCEEMKREREEREKQKQEEKMRREEEDEKRREKEQTDCDEFNQRLKEEREKMEREKEDLQSKHEEEENKMKILMEKLNREREVIKKHEEEKERMKLMMEEERLNQDKEIKRREEEFNEREERHKREMKEQEQIRDEMKREREEFKTEIKEMRKEMETVKKEKEHLQIRYDTETDRLMNRIENERQNHETERKRREEEFNEREEQYKREMKEQEQIRDEMKREREEFKDEMSKEKETVKKEKENLQTEIDRLMNRIENERQHHDKERKRREEEFNEREERYKTLMKEKEREMCEEMKREREEREKQKQEEKRRREEEDEKRREKDKQIQSEMKGEKERIERERREQLEDSEKRLKEERKMREDQQKTLEDKLRLLEEQHEEELKRRRVEWREEHEREKEKMMRKICSETDPSLQVTARYRRLETEYSKWSWSLHRAMMETENKLHNNIENEVIHEVNETDLHRELKKTSEEVETSMSEYFEKSRDKYILIQWKTSFEIKIKELLENIVRETKRKLNEVLQERDLKKKIDAQRTQHESTLYEKSKELALKLRDKANDEETLKREFDVFWKQCVKMIITDTPPIRDIDIMRDVREILRGMYECVTVDHRRGSRDIFTVQSYSDYVKLKKPSGITGALTNAIRSAKETLGYILSQEDESQIRSLVTDVAQQTDRMIQSFNISKMGYNISYIQQLTDNIKARLIQHEEGSVRYVFKNVFFMDLVLSICKRENKMITDQHRQFREDNDPVLYVEKKREECYSIFQKHCHGATSAAIFGQIICQKLKDPIEQSVYKRTARNLADEVRCNCESLNGNRSNLEKHILKTLAEEEDFNKYMNYIHNPREHFKSFIRDEVSRYITDQFSLSVLHKMKENIQLLQQKIMRAAHQSTEHVQENSGDVDLWLKSFTQQLSDELIFSKKHLSGVKHDDVDVKLLIDVIRQKLPAVMSEISSRFNRKSFPVKLDSEFRPDELLIDHFCQCCWVQCPFCGAICTHTTENHDGDHSVAFHRVRGINGHLYRGTTNLSVSICTSAVASNQCFDPKGSDESVLYREYRRAGGVYVKWSISPDLSEPPYWKWFVCRFQTDLEKYYEKTFEGKGETPDEWRKYSKQDALESLDECL